MRLPIINRAGTVSFVYGGEVIEILLKACAEGPTTLAVAPLTRRLGATRCSAST